ncbi:hypothetical protein ABZ901_12240 [Actinacidiphila alni]|uniref:hypothetical protein n=1 Tax=Actinacidiphila alni TaxID=380248 RepID=UPI0033DDDEDA
MSTPPEQPPEQPGASSPSYELSPPNPPQSRPEGQPQSQQQNPPQGPGGYGTPVPVQHNPYAQPTPSPYAPASAYYGPGQPGRPGAVPGQPGSGGRGGAGRAVLWAVVGAAVASALWGGGVLLLDKDSGSDSAKADLRGYTLKSDLCTAADLSAFATEYPQPDSDPTAYSAPGQAVDSMSCSEGLKKTGSSYSDAYLSVEADLHKKTDPAAEFADTWLAYKKRATTYVVTSVAGFGDEAYLVTEDTVAPSTTGSGSSGDREVILAVRDGWLTYSMNWSVYSSSLDTSPVATISEATGWVKSATKATLAKLKS